jgi:hypothetical protein
LNTIMGTLPIQWTPRFVASSVYRSLAQVTADRHALGRSLVCAVCEEESGKRNVATIAFGIEDWDPFAVRFEPGFFRKYIHPANPTSPTTEELCLSMSYGLMQVMGQTARERGFTGKFLTGLCDPETGLEYGCRQLRRCIDLARGDPGAALLRWNGGADTGYPGRVLSRMAKFS